MNEEKGDMKEDKKPLTSIEKEADNEKSSPAYYPADDSSTSD